MTLFFLFISSDSELTGIAEVFDSSLIGRKLSSGIIYNPDEYVASSNKFDYFSVLLLENLQNGEKTIVYIVDKRDVKDPDVILYISKRAAIELGEYEKTQIPVKVTLLKKIDKSEYLNKIGEKDSISETVQKEEGKNDTISQAQDKEEKYYIQVGAFSEEENANKLKEKLLIYGYNAIIEKYQGKTKVIYKVLVGPYTYIEAKEILNILQNLGFKDCFIKKL